MKLVQFNVNIKHNMNDVQVSLEIKILLVIFAPLSVGVDCKKTWQKVNYLSGKELSFDVQFY
jgi:hypothetical protein